MWTRRAVSEGRGLFFTARAAAPTVTLPRLKALVSGTPPTFVDVVRNLAASELREPNFVHEFLAQRAPDGHARTAVFYGDETWLKMFPHTFAPRSEGTTSFFVTVCDPPPILLWRSSVCSFFFFFTLSNTRNRTRRQWTRT